MFEYPVKGLRGNRICCASVNSRGLKMDRRWMIVNSANSFLSQRTLPQMTQFQPIFQDQLVIRDLEESLETKAAPEDFIDEVEVEVWGQVVSARQAPRELNDWLSARLDQPVKLVYMADNDIRPVRNGTAGDIVSFADGYPVLLTATASLEMLNSKLEDKITIDRFRPNIHVTTSRAFEEDEWQKIKIGDTVFRVAKRSARCQVINVNQVTGKATKEPLQALSTFRNVDNHVYFGVNLIPESFGIIHEGDQLEVLAKVSS